MRKNNTRIILKISGELLREQRYIFTDANIDDLSLQIKDLVNTERKIAIVIGGGNILRKKDTSNLKISGVNLDEIGMLATVMNCLVLKNYLINYQIPCSLFSAIAVNGIAKQYDHELALQDFNDNKVVIFAGGTGMPLFTTDTTVAIRAVQMNADMIVKVTNVDGVYDSDPKKNREAIKYQNLTFKKAIKDNLEIMDLTAFEICHAHNINILVGNIFAANGLVNLINNPNLGTLVSN